MKRIPLILSLLLCFAACSEYEALKQEMADLDSRVDAVEKALSQLQGDMAALQKLVDAINSEMTVKKVVPGTVDGVQCWDIYFSDTYYITVRSGAQGDAPAIGVAMDEQDFYWYWTVNGEWLLDKDGERVRASGEQGPSGDPGITPLIDIRNGMWVVSTDGGQSWTTLGPSIDPNVGLIKNVDYTSSDSYVYITLSDETVLTLPKQSKLAISLDCGLYTASIPGQDIKIGYEITGGTKDNVVKAVGQGLWMATVTAETAWKGTINVKAPEELTDCEVVIYVSDGQGYTILSSVNIVTGEFMSDVTVPGFYGACGIDFVYRRNLDQFNILNVEGFDWFRLVIPAESRYYEVGPVPEDVAEGARITMTVDEYLIGEKLSSKEYPAIVMSATPDLVKLASTDGSGIILRR